MASSNTAGAVVPPISSGSAGTGTPAQADVIKLRTKQGRAALHVADRTVKLLRLTEQELETFASNERRGTRQFSIAAFCLGLSINTILALTFSQTPAGTLKGVWIAVAIIAMGLAIFFGNEGRIARGDAKHSLQTIKDQHDLT